MTIRLFAPLILLISCSSPSLSAGSSPPPTKPETTQVTFHTAAGDILVRSEVARTGEARRQGLMHRRELPPHQGMLFIFEKQKTQSFWMKNTYLFLDIIFIDDSHQVVGIVENAEPETLTPRRVAAPSRFVVEVIGGYAAKHGIRNGTRVTFGTLGPALP